MNKRWSFLFALLLCVAAFNAVTAMPKAAENEAAPVSNGVDMPKPKRSEVKQAAKPPDQKPAKSTQKTKTGKKQR